MEIETHECDGAVATRISKMEKEFAGLTDRVDVSFHLINGFVRSQDEVLRRLGALEHGQRNLSLAIVDLGRGQEQLIDDVDKLKLGMAEVKGSLARLESRFDGLESRFDGLETRFDGLESRFDGLITEVSEIKSMITLILGRLPKPRTGAHDAGILGTSTR